MYGIINICLKDLIVQNYGEDTWDKIRVRSGIDDKFINYDNYSDDVTYDAVDAIVEVLGLDKDITWQVFGIYWVVWCMRIKYDSLFHILGRTLEDFIANLDFLHSVYMKTMYPQIIVPSFRVERLPNQELILHYYSNRKGLHGIVTGIVRGVARIIFMTNIKMLLLGFNIETQMGIVKEHYTFHIKKLEGNLPPLEKNGFISQSDWMSILDTDWKGSPETLDDLAAKVENTDQLQGNSQRDLQENMPVVEIKHCPFDYGASSTPLDSGVGNVVPFIDNAIICEAQPYHVIFDEDLNIRQMGNTVQMISSRDLTKTIKFGDIFYLEHPQIDLTARNILKYLDMIFMMQITKSEDETNGKRLTLSLRGQIIWMKRQRLFLFLGSPMLTSFEDLQQRGMHFSDIAAHDVTRDLILFNQQRIAEVELARQLEQKQEELRVLMKALELEKSKTDSLLYSMLPKEVANLLREGKAVVAGEFDEVTILFSDVVKFTDMCSSCEPLKIVHLLNEMYTKFDQLTEKHSVYKVETIGDAYMVVGGIFSASDSHAARICEFAQDQLKCIKDVRKPTGDGSIQIRVGIHSGPVVAGVVGLKMPRYCLFGDTVNTASRMESHGLPGRAHVSENVLRCVTEGNFQFEFRGKVKIKGKGMMPTYFLTPDNTEHTAEMVTSVIRKSDAPQVILEDQEAMDGPRLSIMDTGKAKLGRIDEIPETTKLSESVQPAETIINNQNTSKTGQSFVCIIL